jgi:hypothetical protein
MVQRKSPKGARKASARPRKSSRTYVFPYQSLDPIVQLKGGVPVVSGSSSQENVRVVGQLDNRSREEIQQILRTIERMANSNDHDQILRTIERMSENVENNVIQTLQQLVRDRIQRMEEEIVLRIQGIENLMDRPQVPMDNGERANNVRQNIIDLQEMEQGIIAAVEAYRPLLSQETVRQADRLSAQLDRHLVELDNMKRDIKQTVVDESQNLRTQLLNDIELLQRNTVDNARLQELLRLNREESSEEISVIMQRMFDRLGSSSREDIQNVRTLIQQNKDFQEAEQQILKTLMEELKTDLRSQIDSILRQISTIPVERSSESPVLLESQRRVGELQTEVRLVRGQLSALEESLKTQTARTRDLETQLNEKQSLIVQLENQTTGMSDLQQVIQQMQENEDSIKRQLDRECKTQLEVLRSQLQKLHDEQLLESTNQLKETLGGRIRELETELGDVRRESEGLKTSLQRELLNIQNYQKQLSEIQTVISEAGAESEKAYETQLEMNQRLQQLQSELSRSNEEKTSLENQLRESLEKLLSIERELEKKSALINDLSTAAQDTDSLQQTIESLRRDEEEKLRALEAEIARQKVEDEERISQLQTTLVTQRLEAERQMKELETVLARQRLQEEERVAALEAELSKQGLSEGERVAALEAELAKLRMEDTERIDQLQTTLAKQKAEDTERIRELQVTLVNQGLSEKERVETLETTLARQKAEDEERIRELQATLANQGLSEGERVAVLEAELAKQKAEAEERIRELQTALTKQKLEAEMQMKELQATLIQKNIDSLLELENRLTEENRKQIQDLKSSLEKRIEEIEQERNLSQTNLDGERAKVEILQEELRKAQESNALLQSISGEAEELQKTVTSLQEAEDKRLKELERTLNESHASDIAALASELASAREQTLSEEAAKKAVQTLLQEQITNLEVKLVAEQSRLQVLEQENQENKQKAEALDDLLKEQESDFEQLRKTFAGQRGELEKAIQDLQTQLAEERVKRDQGQENNNQRVQELETLLSQLEEESKRQSEEVQTSLDKIKELENDLITMRDKLNRATTALEETLQEMEKLENIQLDNESLLQTIQEQTALLNEIQKRVVEILQGGNQKFTDKVEENVLTLSEYVKSIKETRSVFTEVLPRYAILIDVPGKLELVDMLSDKKVEFGEDALRMKRRMYEYSAEIYELYEEIRRFIYDTEIIHVTQGRILTQLKKGIVEPPTDMRNLSPLVVVTENDARKLQVLADVFSPIVSTSSTSDNNISITSALMRAFNYQDAVRLTVGIMPDQGLREMLTNMFLQILRSMGKEIPGVNQRLYDVQEMYSIQMLLIDEMKTYLEKSKYYTKDFIYGLEARLIMTDAFIKAYLETKTALQDLHTAFKTKLSGRSAPDRRILSYVRIRADNNFIDPRYSLLVNGDERDKLQISHQPFIVSSLSMNDAETPFYQHDMYGPFTRVFLPNESNSAISENLTDMVNALNNNKDVCTLALGPSGSGKTSTLLYFRGSGDSPIPAQGIIPLMLNRLDGKFTAARVTAFEFAANYETKSTSDYWKKYSVFETPVLFNRGDQEWVSDGPVSMETFSYESSNSVCETSTPFSALLPRRRTDLGDVSIGSFVGRLTDIRLNCGTPNNPVSSRTHLFLFIKLMKNPTDTKGPTLIVADLAGREKTFDCKSEAVLENLAMNKYYPGLNNLLNNPLGTAAESPIIDLSTGEKFDLKNSPMRVRSPESSFNEPDISRFPLKKLMLELSLHTFFDLVDKAGESSVSKGYVTVTFGKQGAERTDISDKYYSALRRFLRRLITEGYPTQVRTRLENLEKQPLELRNLLQKIDDRDLLDGIERVIGYFASDDIKVGVNYLNQVQRKRIEKKVGSPEALTRVLRRLPTYLNTILLIDYMNNVLRTAPVKVCGYRNIEGEFINRSLDELANLVLVAASFSEDSGPAVHPDCLPVSCSFAGLDCLLPKNVPKERSRSAIADVLAEGMGRPSFDVMNTVFCTFVVINLSRSLSEGNLFRPIYDPAETMIKEAVLAFGKLKREMKFYLTDPSQPVTDASRLLNDAYEIFSNFYTTEMKSHAQFKERLEYRGMDPNRMMSENYRKESYRDSVETWTGMRRAINVILEVLSDKDLIKAGAQKILELDTSMRKLEQLGEVIRIKNQDTAIGVLMFADDIVKRGLQPMVCSSVQAREDILPSTVGWTNVQLSI